MKKNPIVILCGWRLTSDKYEPLRKVLKDRNYQVYIPPMPGFAENNPINRVMTLDDYVKYVENFLISKKITRLLLVGHSFGGRIAIKLAVKRPQLIDKLILTGTPGYNPVRGIKIQFFFLISKIGNFFFSVFHLSKLATSAKKLLYRLAGSSDYPQTSGYLRDSFKIITREPLENLMKQIRVPTLLVWGEEDRIVPVKIAQRMSKVIKLSRLVIIPNARHGVLWTEPEKFSDEVEKL